MIVTPTLLLPNVGKKVQVVKTQDENFCTLFSDYKPMPGGQTEFWDVVPFESISDIVPRWVWYRGGVGAGKSFTGAGFVCTRAFLDPESRGLITANSYPQLTTSTLIALVEFCDLFNIPLSPRAATVEETAKAIARARLCKIFDASLLVISAEAFSGATANSKETGRGLQIRYAWADEYAYADKSVFETINGRLGRGKGKIKGLGIITSSINRNNPYNYAHESFVSEDRSEQQKQLFVSVNSATSDNLALDPDYVPSLEASYTPEMIALELGGIFIVSKEGRTFNHFDRTINLATRNYDRNKQFFISFDFNRHPATCIIAQQPDSKTLHIHEEFYLKNSDTFALSETVRDRLDQLNPQQVHIYGDATGRAKTANSQQSNWDIVYAAMAGMMIKKCVPTINPPVIDTVNTVNALLFHKRLTIDPRCKELIKDLETVKFDKQGNLDKKTDLMRCQVVDDLRYLAHGLLPIAKQPSASVPVGAPLVNPFGNR